MMQARRVLQHAQWWHATHREAEQFRRLATVFQQQRAMLGIGPGSRHHARALTRGGAIGDGDALGNLRC
jgi:hypothetical protein